jgi:phenylalanyl-tRNA synthetase beta chain
MNISYKWLRELTGTALSPLELRERLTMVGLAVDSVEEATGGDYVLDVEVPSNRPDCLSHVGIAREVSVMENGRLQLHAQAPSPVGGLMKDYASVEIEDADLCPRYAARVVRGVEIGPSPDWLVQRLEAIGQRAINNVADITNYVLHELGQPLHAFDLALLAEHRIIVRRARAGEKIKTLDDVERALNPEMLVIADAARAVAVAGVMGGAETEINDATRDVLIESAYFSPASVRRTARSLGLNTEASYRFERGADYDGVLRAQERCVQLICEIAGGTATEDFVDVYPQPFEPRLASLRPSRVEALTGLRVQTSEMIRILAALGLDQRTENHESEAESNSHPPVPEETNASTVEVMRFVVPSWRADIAIEEDLVEEVARHTGFEKIATLVPPANSAGEYQPSEGRRRAMRGALTAGGYDEAINFSFIDTTSDERFELIPTLATAAVETAERFITLSNAIIEGATRMRATLLPGLLNDVRYNFNHGTRDVRLFETGRIFVAHETRGELPYELEAFALVATGGEVLEGRAGAPRELDFYDLKGALEAAADAMKIGPLEFEAARARHLREGQSARVLVEGQAIGTIGRLDEGLAAEHKFRQPVYVAEVDFNALLAARESAVLYKPLARYPSIVRDVSLLVNRSMTLAELLRTISKHGAEYCRDAKLVDVYEGEGVPEGKRSVTLRMQYRAEGRTLRDEEVDELHARIVNALEEKFDAKLRK